MICVISYIHEDGLKPYKAHIEPYPLTVTTVSQANHEITGVMWMTYTVGPITKHIPTVVMKSHRSYFIVGINFWEAFNITCQWGDETRQTSSINPWNPTMSDQLKIKIKSIASQPHTKKNCVDQI